MAAGYIMTPGGQMLPGGLRNMGIDAIPEGVPFVPPEPPPIPAPEQPIDPTLLAAIGAPPPTPAGVPAPGPEAPAGVGLTPMPGPVPAALAHFLQTGQIPAPPPAPTPLTNRSPFDATVPPAPAPAAATRPARAPAPAKQPAPSRGPAAARPTGPSGPTLSDVPEMVDQATAARIQAAGMEGDVLGEQATDIYNERLAADATVKEGLAELQRQQQRDAEIRAKKTAEYEAAEKEVDSFKVDHNRYWSNAGTAKKLGWGIAMALAGLGDALQYKSGPNPVIAMLQDTIRQDVAAQMDQRDALRQRLGRKEKALDAADRFSANRFAQEQWFLGQKSQLAAQMVLTAGAKTGDKLAQAKATSIASELYAQGVDAKGKAIQAASQDEIQRTSLAEQVAARKAQIGLGYSQLGETKRHNLAQEDIERGKQKLEFEAAMAKASGEQRKMLLELEKERREGAIFDPATGRPILTPEGRRMVKEAERIDALAEESKSPDEAARLRQNAAAIRGEAELRHPVKVASDVAKSLRGRTAAFQSSLGIIDKIIAVREGAGPQWTTKQEEDQEMGSLTTTLHMMLKGGFEMGALDRGAMAAAMNMTGDASKITVGDVSEWLGAKGNKAALSALGKTLEQIGYNSLRGEGGVNLDDPDSFKFRRSTATPAKSEIQERLGTLKGKTPAETAAGNERSTARKVASGVAAVSPVAGAVQALGIADVLGDDPAAPSVSLKYKGLSPEQELAFDRVMEVAQSKTEGIGDPVLRKKVRDEAKAARRQLKEIVVSGWRRGSGGREALSTPLLDAIGRADPELYKETLSALPPGPLVERAQAGDQAAHEELMGRDKGGLSVDAKNYVERAKAEPRTPDIAIDQPGGEPVVIEGVPVSQYESLADVPTEVLQRMVAQGDRNALAELVERANSGRKTRTPMALSR